jgi:hypothetical protein
VTTTDLDDVQDLLRRVLPDPSGFAERLLQQATEKWSGRGLGEAVPDLANALGHDTVVVTPSSSDDAPHDVVNECNLLLAAALGACRCWGMQSTCPLCKGCGSSGWVEPEQDLFQEFVGPAVERLSRGDSTSRDGQQGVSGARDRSTRGDGT